MLVEEEEEPPEISSPASSSWLAGELRRKKHLELRQLRCGWMRLMPTIDSNCLRRRAVIKRIAGFVEMRWVRVSEPRGTARINLRSSVSRFGRGISIWLQLNDRAIMWQHMHKCLPWPITAYINHQQPSLHFTSRYPYASNCHHLNVKSSLAMPNVGTFPDYHIMFR